MAVALSTPSPLSAPLSRVRTLWDPESTRHVHTRYCSHHTGPILIVYCNTRNLVHFQNDCHATGPVRSRARHHVQTGMGSECACDNVDAERTLSDRRVLVSALSAIRWGASPAHLRLPVGPAEGQVSAGNCTLLPHCAVRLRRVQEQHALTRWRTSFATPWPSAAARAPPG